MDCFDTAALAHFTKKGQFGETVAGGAPERKGSMVSESTSELAADIAELKDMLQRAQRPAVREELQRVLTKLEAEQLKAKSSEAAPAATSPKVAPATAQAAAPAVDVRPVGPWTEITTFALDLGGYNKPDVSIDLRLKGVEELPAESLTCDFKEDSFDLKIMGLDGKNHRFVRTNLEKDIVPAESSFRVKKNHVIITLRKVKGEYGYDSWVDLCAKGKRKPAASKSENPQDSIMSMMKDLYDEGDDNMKKIIGEAMYKARSGEKTDLKDPPKPSLDEMEL
ncbi:Calcyclin-binding protein [Symbiodinium microadriaticum]|uniref:Calcyclin-binding protein n=1 Tax=Symbiodinium microadriaticum TaxID=2951 RepID=A0A1Q9EPM9_SYMMI|nr:Calcyclin-binding protein [Symbiodinium microadriaticum]CAE7859613.1 CACYBP [Symbiodinium microadriaticum]